MRAQSRDWKAWVRPARHHQLHRPRRVLDETCHGLVAQGTSDDVPVVEDHHEVGCVGQLADEEEHELAPRSRPARRRGRRATCRRQAGGPPAIRSTRWAHRRAGSESDGSSDTHTKGVRARSASAHCASERGLSVAGRRADEGQPALTASPQQLEKVGPLDELRARTRDAQLRRDDGRERNRRPGRGALGVEEPGHGYAAVPRMPRRSRIPSLGATNAALQCPPIKSNLRVFAGSQQIEVHPDDSAGSPP